MPGPLLAGLSVDEFPGDVELAEVPRVSTVGLNAWLFPTGVTCHVLLVAALRNPTVRLRYRHRAVPVPIYL
jgi:hypothetical protein